jgi:hypothetical protein
MAKMKTIAFPRGGIIPAALLGLQKDKVCSAHEPVDVPCDYADHLIHDRFAYEAEKPTAKKADAGSSTKTKTAKSAGKADAHDSAAPEILNGSNTLPAMIEIGVGASVPLGNVVLLAHKESGLSADEWNALDEAERDQMLSDTIDALKADQAALQV